VAIVLGLVSTTAGYCVGNLRRSSRQHEAKMSNVSRRRLGLGGWRLAEPSALWHRPQNFIDRRHINGPRGMNADRQAGNRC
jgi:hypothetical protein